MCKRVFQPVVRLFRQAQFTTVLLSATSGLLVARQFGSVGHPDTPGGLVADDQSDPPALWELNRRVKLLQACANPVDRDMFCIPISAMSRALDRGLDPEARVFVANALGTDHPVDLAAYCSLRNYLFPREVEISLDGKAVLVGTGFIGVTCNSPEQLQSNRFDALIEVSSNASFDVIPLSPKGALR